MIQASFHDTEGRILQIGTLFDTGECDATRDALAGCTGWVEGHWDAELAYVLEGQAVTRPELAITVEPGLISSSTVPDGSEVLVEGEIVGTVQGPLEIALPFAADWLVEIRPPFPWKPWKQQVSA